MGGPKPSGAFSLRPDRRPTLAAGPGLNGAAFRSTGMRSDQEPELQAKVASYRVGAPEVKMKTFVRNKH